MPRFIITALVMLAALAYCVLFATWNMAPVKVVGWRMGGQELWESVPLAYVALAGLAAGVLAMIIASAIVWAGQRGELKKMSAQIQRAREVIEGQRKRIEELEAALAQAEAALEQREQPVEVTVEPPEETAPAEPTEHEAAAEATAPSPEPAAEDDEEVI
ncbi:MAG: hypothetical protein H5T86_09675 [Armatimonadetes bacterium]|nr:hypothetical protein [Armatimonadota bacterium]